MAEREALGHIACPVCQTVMTVYPQGGKRSNYLYGKCECGNSANMTGKKYQTFLSGYKTESEAQADLDAMLAGPVTKPAPESKSEPEPEHVPLTEPNPAEVPTGVKYGLGAVLVLACIGVRNAFKAAGAVA